MKYTKVVVTAINEFDVNKAYEGVKEREEFDTDAEYIEHMFFNLNKKYFNNRIPAPHYFSGDIQADPDGTRCGGMSVFTSGYGIDEKGEWKSPTMLYIHPDNLRHKAMAIYTVLHEMCHLAAFKDRPEDDNTIDGGHGRGWKEAMISCNMSPFIDRHEYRQRWSIKELNKLPGNPQTEDKKRLRYNDPKKELKKDMCVTFTDPKSNCVKLGKVIGKSKTGVLCILGTDRSVSFLKDKLYTATEKDIEYINGKISKEQQHKVRNEYDIKYGCAFDKYNADDDMDKTSDSKIMGRMNCILYKKISLDPKFKELLANNKEMQKEVQNVLNYEKENGINDSDEDIMLKKRISETGSAQSNISNKQDEPNLLRKVIDFFHEKRVEIKEKLTGEKRKKALIKLHEKEWDARKKAKEKMGIES